MILKISIKELNVITIILILHMEQVMGLEPMFLVWKTNVLTTTLYLHILLAEHFGLEPKHDIATVTDSFQDCFLTS